MSKKMKFLTATLCGALLISNIAITNVNAKTLQVDKKITSSTIYTPNYAATSYNINATYNAPNVLVEYYPSDSKKHSYTTAILLYDKNNNRIGMLNDQENNTSGRYAVNMGTYQNWYKAEVVFNADNVYIGTRIVYHK
ncbi:hypothetical protein HBE96_08200 [Clostridium sp. P21]|uniref:Uncharacterized protein n=1 Tax=Clostridium muellerianum TaxID=2716538 RepID=A0A7Y0EFU6_9CLOT|nr:hypothetical protein [Clostridium muellerianum]NMM62675.1 hypothetical protein [Clostridium muellerianum]